MIEERPTRHQLTERVDRIVLHPVWGSLLFAAVMVTFFQLIFSAAGPAMDLIDGAIAGLAESARAALPAGGFADLVADGLIAGVGSDPRITQVIRALLQTARSLGVTLVAEGVEDEAQAVFLRAAGCDQMQGYLFARPMSATDTHERLKSQPAIDKSPDRNMGVLRAFSRAR